MKPLLTFSLILISLSSYSQTTMERVTGSNRSDKTDTTAEPTSITFLRATSTWRQPPSSVRFMGVEINNEYMRIDSVGNLFYRPSAFCKCDTGNSMKFLLNIFKPGN